MVCELIHRVKEQESKIVFIYCIFLKSTSGWLLLIFALIISKVIQIKLLIAIIRKCRIIIGIYIIYNAKIYLSFVFVLNNSSYNSLVSLKQELSFII